MRTLIRGLVGATIPFAAALYSAPVALAQVVISEINFPDPSGPDQWIELHNLGGATVDLGSWSIYYTTDAPGSYFCTGAGGGPATARC